jgi:hypothetical protein
MNEVTLFPCLQIGIEEITPRRIVKQIPRHINNPVLLRLTAVRISFL